MQKVKLSCHIIQIRGVSYKPEDICETLSNESVVLLRANNIKDGKINFDDVVYVNRRKVKSEQFLKRGDVLICTSSGSKDLVGKAAFITADYDVVFGAFCKVLRSIDINARYLGHYFQSDYYKDQIIKSCQGANINNLRAEHFNELLIRLPLTEEAQKSIAEKLDKVMDLIEKRKKQIEKLDELVKSRFIEMFGDPIKNEKIWKSEIISNVCVSIIGGGTPSKSCPEYFRGNIPWVTPKDMKTNIIEDSIDHISEEAINKSTTNLVPVNSVLMVIRSGILKHSLPIAINRKAVTINQDMKAFIPNNIISATYLMFYFKSIESTILDGVRAVTADNIDFKDFVKRKILLPPIELQNKFAEFVEKVEKNKSAIKKSLSSLEILKKSLMQKYFG